MTTTNETNNELQDLAENARQLLEATSDQAGEKVAEARRRLSAALDKGREALGAMQDRCVAGAKATDKVIRDNPYPAMAVAFGAGALLAMMLCRNSK